jgi:FkbM family methyltransferase
VPAPPSPPADDTEAERLAATYGPDKSSENAEEWIIRDFFGDLRGGVFVDVGANHYRKFSNTYYLETSLGWSGLAIEPQREFGADYARHRPRTRFVPFFVSDISNREAKMFVSADNTLVTSAVKEFTERWGKEMTAVTAPTITLTDLLDAERIARVDLLSMDIELWEPKALAGFDISRFKPAFVCIEAHPQVRQEILDYFARHHYVVVGKYLRADAKNLYFAPLGAAPRIKENKKRNT